MDPGRNAVYCTLLLSDHYLPGAMVLAHSLRDSGTQAKLVALFTPDKLQETTITELRTVYDKLIPVHSIVNATPANLWLMDRPDLIATFTKIELWRLTQFERVVYIDCDVVAVRAPDELFSLEVDFAAAPDVGWPDCFNSGLMVLRPNMQDYYALKALAERGISFDGADQGLLNMHFRDWHRLSFSYNCTPSANYQYIPAYKHFQGTISLIHFIGSQKPWNLPRQVVPLESPYNQLLGKWWAVYDRYYKPSYMPISSIVDVPPLRYRRELPLLEQEVPLGSSHSPQDSQLRNQEVSLCEQGPNSHYVQHVEETRPVSLNHEDIRSSTAEAARHSLDNIHSHHSLHSNTQNQSQHCRDLIEINPAGLEIEVPVMSVVPQYVRGEEHVSAFRGSLPHTAAPIPHAHQQGYDVAQKPYHSHGYAEHRECQVDRPEPVLLSSPTGEVHSRLPSPEPTFEAPKAEWDASREPPPLNTKPEGMSLEQKTYTMSEDTNLFQPPPSYPKAPKNMYYQVPEKKPEPEKMIQLFPWESNAPKPTRVFAHDQPTPLPEFHTTTAVPTPGAKSRSPPNATSPQARYKPSSDSWEHYSRSNAWDEDPNIQRYIESLQQARHARTQVVSGSTHTNLSATSHQRASPLSSSNTTVTTGLTSVHRPSIKLTDFPTEVERPSLPVTPAPIHRNMRIGGADEDADTSSAGLLPAAEGVPSQEDWNPLAQLEQLRRRQSQALDLNPEQLLGRLAESQPPYLPSYLHGDG